MTSPMRAKLAAVMRGATFSPESGLGLLGNLPWPEKEIPGEPDIKNGQPLSVELKIIRR